MAQLMIPKFGEGCITELLPALLGRSTGSLPAEFPASGARILLVLDGLGWEQLGDRHHIAPNLSAMAGGAITAVAPSTTATALTSIATGLPPGQHGVVGYRMMMDGDVLNTLRWSTDTFPDARKALPPESLQPFPPFQGQSLALVSKAEFRNSGFTRAHLRGGRLFGYRTPAMLVHEILDALRNGEQAVYAYYDGVDKVAHEYGLGGAYEAELAFVDRLVGDLLAAAPAGTTLMVSADHGQVDCGDNLLKIHPEVMSHTAVLSGEGRFRWMHAVEGHSGDLLSSAGEYHSDKAWVVSAEEMVDQGWFGSELNDDVRSRLGEVALLPFESVAYEDPADTGPFELISRHGSLTSAEMLVPCIAATV